MSSRVKITSVVSEGQGTLPVLVEFENGKINPTQSQHLECQLYRDPRKVNNKIVSIINDKSLYVGSTGQSKKSYRTYLALRNRRTNSVQLVQVESVRATPILQTAHLINKDASDNDERTTQKARLELSRVFGSKIQRRLEEQKLKFKVESKTAEELKEIVKDKLLVAENAAVIPDHSLEDLLPPCNREALYPTEVYDLDDILDEEQLESLKTAYTEMSKEEDFLSKCSPFFCSLQAACDDDVRSLAFLLYAEYLIQLCNKYEVRELYEICDASPTVAKRMMNEFTTASRGKARKLPSSGRDKAVLRVMIIGLNIGKFRLDLNTLNDSIRGINLTRLKMLARVTGATTKESNTNIVVLKVPLPQISLGGAFKKRPRKY